MKPTTLYSIINSILLSLMVSAANAQELSFTLWPDGPPTENGLTGDETPGGCTGNISTATLSVHLPSKAEANGMAIVVIPGGGYKVVCEKTEGSEIATKLNTRGIAAIVLKYRLPNQHHLIPATDARRAIRTVRHRAREWGIKPNKVGVWGFSAGGHLASTVSTVFDASDTNAADPIERQSSRPDFSILFYPVISMELGVTHNGSRHNLIGDSPTEELIARYSNERRVTPNTPPTFIVHAADDRVVPIENALRYYQGLLAQKVTARMVLFETGGHGPSVFKNNPSVGPALEEWLAKQ